MVGGRFGSQLDRFGSSESPEKTSAVEQREEFSENLEIREITVNQAKSIANSQNVEAYPTNVLYMITDVNSPRFKILNKEKTNIIYHGGGSARDEKFKKSKPVDSSSLGGLVDDTSQKEYINNAVINAVRDADVAVAVTRGPARVFMRGDRQDIGAGGSGKYEIDNDAFLNSSSIGVEFAAPSVKVKGNNGSWFEDTLPPDRYQIEKFNMRKKNIEQQTKKIFTASSSWQGVVGHSDHYDTKHRPDTIHNQLGGNPDASRGKELNKLTKEQLEQYILQLEEKLDNYKKQNVSTKNESYIYVESRLEIARELLSKKPNTPNESQKKDDDMNKIKQKPAPTPTPPKKKTKKESPPSSSKPREELTLDEYQKHIREMQAKKREELDAIGRKIEEQQTKKEKELQLIKEQIERELKKKQEKRDTIARHLSFLVSKKEFEKSVSLDADLESRCTSDEGTEVRVVDQNGTKEINIMDTTGSEYKEFQFPLSVHLRQARPWTIAQIDGRTAQQNPYVLGTYEKNGKRYYLCCKKEGDKYEFKTGAMPFDGLAWVDFEGSMDVAYVFNPKTQQLKYKRPWVKKDGQKTLLVGGYAFHKRDENEPFFRFALDGEGNNVGTFHVEQISRGVWGVSDRKKGDGEFSDVKNLNSKDDGVDKENEHFFHYKFHKPYSEDEPDMYIVLDVCSIDKKDMRVVSPSDGPLSFVNMNALNYFGGVVQVENVYLETEGKHVNIKLWNENGLIYWSMERVVESTESDDNQEEKIIDPPHEPIESEYEPEETLNEEEEISSQDEISSSNYESTEKVYGLPFGMPVDGEEGVDRVYTSPHNEKRTKNGKTYYHKGVDMAPLGHSLEEKQGMKVLAMANGYIVHMDYQYNSKTKKGYGRRIVIRHDIDQNGDGEIQPGETFFTQYSHLEDNTTGKGYENHWKDLKESFDKSKESGEPISVSKGDHIGYIGNSGGVYGKTGYHLDLEMRRTTQQSGTSDQAWRKSGISSLNPKEYIDGKVVSITDMGLESGETLESDVIRWRLKEMGDKDFNDQYAQSTGSETLASTVQYGIDKIHKSINLFFDKKYLSPFSRSDVYSIAFMETLFGNSVNQHLGEDNRFQITDNSLLGDYTKIIYEDKKENGDSYSHDEALRILSTIGYPMQYMMSVLNKDAKENILQKAPAQLTTENSLFIALMTLKQKHENKSFRNDTSFHTKVQTMPFDMFKKILEEKLTPKHIQVDEQRAKRLHTYLQSADINDPVVRRMLAMYHYNAHKDNKEPYALTGIYLSEEVFGRKSEKEMSNDAEEKDIELIDLEEKMRFIQDKYIQIDSNNLVNARIGDYQLLLLNEEERNLFTVYLKKTGSRVNIFGFSEELLPFIEDLGEQIVFHSHDYDSFFTFHEQHNLKSTLEVHLIPGQTPFSETGVQVVSLGDGSFDYQWYHSNQKLWKQETVRKERLSLYFSLQKKLLKASLTDKKSYYENGCYYSPGYLGGRVRKGIYLSEDGAVDSELIDGDQLTGLSEEEIEQVINLLYINRSDSETRNNEYSQEIEKKNKQDKQKRKENQGTVDTGLFDRGPKY